MDIGLTNFSAANGFERIEAAAGTGKVRLIGGWGNESLDFSQTTFVGDTFVLDGYYGNDTIIGSAAADTIIGGGNDDRLDGGEGSDTYIVTGSQAGGWASFAGIDTYADSGTSGTDRILAVGPGDVDIGLTNFSAANGIERIEAAAGTGKVRLLGGWGADSLNFSQISFVGDTFVLDGAYGNDTILGSAGADRMDGGADHDRLIGGLGADLLTGGSGNDTFAFNAVAEIGLAPGSRDIITDFVSQMDKLDFSQIDANVNLAGDQAFIYVGGVVFSGCAGELRLSDQILSGDVKGDAEADFKLVLTNVFALSPAKDILL
ncbi:MAG: calcium-binding protein [Cyanobacteriota bacterium]